MRVSPAFLRMYADNLTEGCASLGGNGPLTRYVKFRVAHAPGMPGTFSRLLRVSDPDMHHGTCVTRVPWYIPGSLTSGFLWSGWPGKRSRHSKRMRNPQFYASGNRPIRGSLVFSVLCHPLKTKNHEDTNFVVTGSTEYFHNDNGQIRHHGDSQFPAVPKHTIGRWDYFFCDMIILSWFKFLWRLFLCVQVRGWCRAGDKTHQLNQCGPRLLTLKFATS